MVVVEEAVVTAAVVVAVGVEVRVVVAGFALGKKIGVVGDWRDFLLEMEGAHKEVPHVGVRVEGKLHR